MSQKVIYVFLEKGSDADWSEKILQANKHSTPSLSSEGKNKLLSQLTHIMFYKKKSQKNRLKKQKQIRLLLVSLNESK